MPTLILAALTVHFGVLQDRQCPAPIPMQRGVDSLNVAAAAAVACWELTAHPAPEPH